MKIMFYINVISFGGAERVIVNLANQFSNKGHDVIFVTSYKMNQEYFLNESIKRELLIEKSDYKFFKKNFFCVKNLRILIKKNRPDIVISFMAEPNFRLLVASLGLKTKTLISVRNDPNREYGNMIFKIAAKILYRFAHGIVFQTKDAQLWFAESIRKKSRIILNQVNSDFFNVLQPKVHKDIVTVGRLVDQKNHELLIKAFSIIKDKIDDNLYIYGEGEKREFLEDLIEELQLADRVFLPGTIQDVPNTIKGAKIFVLSSDYEGMPNALIEAMALGLPCISTECPCGGPKEIFDNEKNGLLVPIGDECLLAEKMLHLIENECDRIRLSENAFNTSKRFMPEIVFNEWSAYVNELVTNS